MSLHTTSSSLHLQLPTTGPSSASRPPTSVTCHPAVLASILDHHSRRQSPSGAPPPRAIGALLGSRNEATGELEVRRSFGLPHTESAEGVAVDMEYYRRMYELEGKVAGGNAGREQVVGWYSSTATINPYSALIQNFFAQEVAQTSGGGSAVHLTVDSEGGMGVRAYVATPIGLAHKPENCVFLPVPCSLKYHLTERAGIDLLTRSAEANGAATDATIPPLAALSASLKTLSEQLESVRAYASGSGAKDPEVGRYLLDAVGRWKAEAEAAIDAGADADEEKKQQQVAGGEEPGVKRGLQDILSVSYLSALIRTQVELSARLNLLT